MLVSDNDRTSSKGVSYGEGFDGYKFRVVLLGEASVGKTALIRRYTENVFDEEYKQTIGTTFATNDEVVIADDGEKRNVRLVLWDMGGQATYRELRRQFMNGAAGAVIVYDVTRPETFMAMNNWFESFREACPEADVCICANKIDLKDSRMVPVEPGIMLRDWFQASYYETSAKSGESVDSVFKTLAEKILKRTLIEKSRTEL
ncbi:MAG: GTP-binding protein [Candidatus Lokiarchaeota archaeon]|nr:GTP-binding protein [Candidatus Lokiarchaeota archaeon]